MRHFLLVLMFLFHGTTAWSENKLIVTKVPQGQADPKGVVYALPKTVVGVELTFKKTTVTKGEFAAHTAKFFDIKKDKYPLEDSTEFTVDSATIKSRQVADPTELYRVNITKEWMKDHHFALEFAEDGTLTKGEQTITNRRVDFFLNIFGSVASIAGKFFGLASETAAVQAATAKDVKETAEAKEVREAREEREKSEAACRKLIRVAAKDPDAALGVGPEAKNAFCEIVQLSRRRQALVLGDNYLQDGTTALLQDIDAQLKKKFNDNFTGGKEEKTWSTRFEDIPTDTGAALLVKFDDKCGITELGAPWIDSQIGDGFDKSEKCPAAGTVRAVSLTYERSRADSLHSRFKKALEEPKEHSFAFRIPALFEAQVVESPPRPRSQTRPCPGGAMVGLLTRGDVAVAQLGVVGYMPSDVGGKKSSITVTLHANGALKSVDVGVEAQGNTAETVGAAASGLVDAALARRKAAQDAADETSQTEKKQKLLEAQVAIQRAQCILDGLCPLNPK